jgi:alpha-ketoglutarate-dependent taurine dioxygenase
MKIKLHENNWTVIIEDLKLQDATVEQAHKIGQLIATNTVVVIRNQQLSVQDEINFCSQIGKLESWQNKNILGIDGYLVPDSDRKVIRVTGELDEHGRPGLFGHVSDLDWHSNNTANEWREPIVWLYGVKGTKGSRTSWLNNILSYQELDNKTKDQLKEIKIINGYKQYAYSELHFGKEIDVNYTYKPNLVQTNIAGITGLFFPFLQIHQIDGLDEIESKKFIENLRDKILQEKYMYHHDWEDGDVVLSEQWLSIHKRWRFEDINNRVLHRICLDFDNCRQMFE